MELFTIHMAFLLALLILVPARSVGWRWGLVAFIGWFSSGMFLAAAAAVGFDGVPGQILLAITCVFYAGVLALLIGNIKLFHWLVGFFGLPALVFVLGGPG